MTHKPGTLFIVATPIGNLADISERALAILKQVDHIAVEDTRHSAPLLKQFGIHKPLKAIHDHNERLSLGWFSKELTAGHSIALISDAGTPLIADPGYHLVSGLRALNFTIVPIPGPCALITALSASGLATDHFCFEGFLSAKTAARLAQLEALCFEQRTMVFYEAPHRILETLHAMHSVFGETRLICVARELTKTFETIKTAPLAEIIPWIEADTNQQRGEFVVMVAGAPAPDKQELSADEQRLLTLLRRHMPLKAASHLAAEYTGKSKNAFYDFFKIYTHFIITIFCFYFRDFITRKHQ